MGIRGNINIMIVVFLAGALLSAALFYGWSQIRNKEVTLVDTIEAHVEDPHFSSLPPCSPDTTPIDTSGASVVITYPTDMSCIQSGSSVTIQATVPDSSSVKKVVFDIYTNYKPGGKGVTYKFTCEDTTAPYTCDWQVPKGKTLGWTYYIAPSVESNSGNVSYGRVIRVYTANK